MRDIVKDAATVALAKHYEAAHHTAEHFVSMYTESPEERRDMIEFLVDLEIVYRKYPKDEWLHLDYSADPIVLWMTY